MVTRILLVIFLLVASASIVYSKCDYQQEWANATFNNNCEYDKEHRSCTYKKNGYTNYIAYNNYNTDKYYCIDGKLYTTHTNSNRIYSVYANSRVYPQRVTCDAENYTYFNSMADYNLYVINLRRNITYMLY